MAVLTIKVLKDLMIAFLSFADPCQIAFIVNLAPSCEWTIWTQTSLKNQNSSKNSTKMAFMVNLASSCEWTIWTQTSLKKIIDFHCKSRPFCYKLKANKITNIVS